MQIKHLSPMDFQQIGQILPYPPEEDSLYQKRQLTFSKTSEIPRYQASGSIILDYVSGMSLLVIYRNSQPTVFYLDRVISLYPGTQFSIVPLGETCCVEMVTAQIPEPIDFVPAAFLEDNAKSLQFEKIYTFLYQECNHNFYFRGERHLPYELVYVDRGQMHNLVGGQDILLDQQDIMIIDSNDWHTQYSDESVSFLTISFWLADNGLSSITNKAIKLTPKLKSILKKMLSQSQVGPYGDDYISSLLKILLIELLQTSAPTTTHQLPSENESENQIVDRAIRIISQNIQKKLTLEELAAKIHISVPYLYKLFQENLGTSPGKYIARIRIEECKMLLREGRLNMGQIANLMGFSSLQHFSRQFHNICGMTPSQYVRSLR